MQPRLVFAGNDLTEAQLDSDFPLVDDEGCRVGHQGERGQADEGQHLGVASIHLLDLRWRATSRCGAGAGS